MKKKIIVITSVIVIAITWGIVKYRSPSASPDATNTWVRVSKVNESTLPSVAHAMGTLVARSVEITPEIAGHVHAVYFTDGSFVKKGSPLIQLDDALYKAKYESTKAQLGFSENDYKRKMLLGKKGVIAQQAIDQAVADLNEKRANTQENAVMVSKMRLLAPFDGVIGKSKVDLGDYVTTGQSLVTLTDTKHLRIEYNVPEKYLPLLKVGQLVNLVSSTYPDKEFSGKVSFISPAINTENRSVSLYADVSNDNDLLAAGMFMNVVQSLGTEEHVIMIPARSLVPVLDGEQVYKIVDGKAYGVSILIGKRSEEQVQVIKGLSPGDLIITDGQLKVKNGMPVQIKNNRG